MRPLFSYVEDGSEAYCEDVAQDGGPYERGSLRDLQWRLGWLNASLIDPMASFEMNPNGWIDLEAFEEEKIHLKSAAKNDISNALFEVRALAPDVAEVEAAFGPSETWPKNCYAVAASMQRHGLLERLEAAYGPAKLSYGMFEGFISDKSPFANRAFARHGWIEFEAGFVVDPTRWVFTGTRPSIHVGTIEDYDLASRRFRDRFIGRRPAPEFSGDIRIQPWDVNDPDITKLVHDLLGKTSRIESERRIDMAQAHWLANLPIDSYGEHAGEVYRVFERMGFSALVPIDNRNWAKDVAANFGLEDPSPAPRM